MTKSKQKGLIGRLFRRKPLAWLGVAILFLAGILLILELSNTTHFFHKSIAVIPSTTPGRSSQSHQTPTSKPSTSGQNTGPTADKTPSSTGGGAVSSTLMAPY